MPAIKSYFLFLCLLLCKFSQAQNYQAINGSSYAGSLSTGNNPAAIVHVPFPWDVTLFAVQFKHTTNAFKIEKYSLLSSPGSAEISSQNGTKKRYAFANQDIRLLNARINLNSKTAIAFGSNIRNYLFSLTGQANWQDTISTLGDFMKINTAHLPLSGEFTGSAWAELYATFAKTIIDDGDRLLNAGITVKLNRALAGGYTRAKEINYTTAANAPGYVLTNSNVRYGYSYNFDFIDSAKSTTANRKLFLQKTNSSLSADAGFEYILLADEEDGEGSSYAYRTKIGLSLMDIGYNKFRHGNRSRLSIAGAPGLVDTLIEDKFSGANSLDDFNDSLATISNSLTAINGNFNIYQPARVVINIDQHIIYNFFINAELTIPILPVVANNALFIRDINLLAVTPRWEIKSFGAYFPILLNTKKQMWVGGAFKAGPLLLGTHNLANLFAKNATQSGGLYLALTIRPGKSKERFGNEPNNKLSKKARRGLDCPRF